MMEKTEEEIAITVRKDEHIYICVLLKYLFFVFTVYQGHYQ